MTNLLDGVKVVSLTHYLQGPACVQILADLGADVIKVERQGGAYERHWSGAQSYIDDQSVFFLLAGRNQRSIELDFRREEGRDVLRRLIEDADVLVENFRPGVLSKYGFSYEDVTEYNPGIIYCSLTGFGSEGPKRADPGQDLLIQSFSGMASISGAADSPPMLVGSAIIDQHAATLGAVGILAALFGRTQSGKGKKVDSNLLSAALDLQSEPFTYHLNGGGLYPRSESGISSRFHQAPYGVFRTSDGWLTLSLADGPTLGQAFDDSRFIEWTREDQFNQREEVNVRVAKHMLTRTSQEWEGHFRKIGVWHSPVRDYSEVESDPQLEANQSILTLELKGTKSARVLAHPLKYDGKVPGVRRLPPTPGEHTEEILSQAGMSLEQIDALRENGTIGSDRTETPFNLLREAPATAYSKK